MAIQHSAIVLDAHNHEPKGCPTAAANKVYMSDGAASGAWKRPAGTAYADMYIDAGATAQTLNAVAGTYDLLNPGTEWHQGSVLNATTTPASGILTLTYAGTYSLDFWVSLTTGAIAAGAVYYFKYAVGGTPSTRIVSMQKNTAGADRINCSASGIVTVTAGQTISIIAASSVNSAAITVNDAGITAVLLKEA